LWSIHKFIDILPTQSANTAIELSSKRWFTWPQSPECYCLLSKNMDHMVYFCEPQECYF